MVTGMRRISVFNHVSVDGFFVDKKGDMSWAHMAKKDEEWDAFVFANGNVVLSYQPVL